MGNISKGAKGKSVAQLQKALNKNGAKPKLKEDSAFGPLTDAAVRSFQKKNKMKPDGIAGSFTSFALNIGSRPKNLKWPIKDFNPKKELKGLAVDLKDMVSDFSAKIDILDKALDENDSLKKALMDRAKMLEDRKKAIKKFADSLLSDGKEMLKLQLASEKSTNFAEINEMYKKSEEINARRDDSDVDAAIVHLKAFDQTVKDIEKFQEGVKALKSKLKKTT